MFNLQNTTTITGRSGSSSQPIPRAKETLQRVAAPRISSEKHSDYNDSVVDFSKEHPRSCDICRRSETLLNPILVCCSCKVGNWHVFFIVSLQIQCLGFCIN